MRGYYQEEFQFIRAGLSGESLLKNRFKLALKGGYDRRIYTYVGVPFFKYYCVEGTHIMSFTTLHHLIPTKTCVETTFKGFYHI